MSGQTTDKRLPVVLAIGGHDPSGGAGIQADIETISALGAHPVTAITALTVQDTVDVRSLHPIEPGLVSEQIRCVLNDIGADVIKIGLLGSTLVADVVARVLDDYPSIPLVFDPVLAAGGGSQLSDSELRQEIRERILPRALLATPNSPEAVRLSGAAGADQAAEKIMELGCDHVLITGGHDDGDEIINRYYGPDDGQDHWAWPRLAGEYHGSGCTLASACATLLARGLPMKMALRLGQAFTHDALVQAHSAGHGQLLPRRVLSAALSS